MAREYWSRALRALGVLAAFVAMTGASSPGLGDAEADRLLERHVAWLGSRSALAALRDLTWTGTWSGAGLTGSVKLSESRAGWRHRETNLGVVTSLDVVGPVGAWTRNWAGQVETVAADDAETEKRDAWRDFGAPLVGALPAERSDLGEEEHEGRRWRVLRFRWEGGDAFDLFLDPADGACTWIRETRDTDVFWTRLDDWRRVAGVRLPFERRTQHQDPRLDETFRWSSVEANRGLEEAVFGQPAPTASVTRFGGASATPAMEMELAEGRWVYIDGQIGGRKVPMLLDSGAQVTTLCTTLAAELGLKKTGTIRMEGTTSAQQAALAASPDIEIGPLRVSGLTVVVTDLRGLSEAMGRPTRLILGRELFNDAVVELDYPASRIRFHARAGYRPDPAARVLRLRAGPSGHKLVEGSVEGQPAAPFVLDTGSGDTLALFGPYVEGHGLLRNRSPRSQSYARGIGGGAVATVATLKSFRLDGLEFKDVPAEFHGDGEGGFHTRRAAGNLGAGLLARFRIVLDYTGERMYVIPAPGWDRKPFRKNRAGIEADFRGSFLEVVFVAPGSPASRAGWTAGQHIVAIDGQPIGPDYLQARSEWIYGEPGSTVVLSSGDGARHTLVLADYY